MNEIKIIPNLFETAGRQTIMAEGETLLELIPAEYHAPEWTAIVPTRGAVQFVDWAHTPISPGEQVTVKPRIEDPSTITLAGIAGFLAKTVVASAISMALSYGIRALAGKPTKPVMSDSSFSDSSHYRWEGPQTQADVGIRIPVIYGKARVGGNFINVFTTNEVLNTGDKDEDGFPIYQEDNYLHMLIALCEGEVRSIAGIQHDVDPWTTKTYQAGEHVTYKGALYTALRQNAGKEPDENGDDWELSLTIGDRLLIDNNPIQNLKGVEISIRRGLDVQSPIRWFNQIHNQRDITVQLKQNEKNYLSTDDDDVEAVNFEISMPQCIRVDKGNYEAPSPIQIDFYYRPYSESKPLGESGSWTKHGTLMFQEKTLNDVRRQYRINDLSPGRYQFKVVRDSHNSSPKSQVDLFLQTMDEIKYDTLSYPNTALIGIRALATNQLSGSVSNVLVEVEGRRIERFSAGVSQGIGYTTNPMWCIRDLILNVRYGLGDYYKKTEVDKFLDYWQVMADYCDELVTIEDGSGGTEKRFTLNIVLDSEQNAMDLLQIIGDVCRCSLLWVGGALLPIIEKPEVPTQLFTMGNIVRGSFQGKCLSNTRNPNVLELSFINEENDWTRDILQVEDSAGLEAAREPIAKSQFVPGITKESRLKRHGLTAVRAARYPTRAISFKAGPDAITCRLMEVINFAHGVPGWGLVSGRLSAGAALSVTLKEDVTLAPATSYYITVRTASDDGQQTRLITSAAGTYAAGTPLTVGVAFNPVPAAYDLFVIGDPKPFRILDMTRTDEGEVEIAAIEYLGGTPGNQASIDAGIYSDKTGPVRVKNYSTLKDPRRAPAALQNFLVQSYVDYYVQAIATWKISAMDDQNGLYYEALIEVSEDSGRTWKVQGRTMGRQLEMTNLVPGRTYQFRGYALNKYGIRSLVSAVRTIKVTAPAPPNVTGLELKGQGNNTIFKRDAAFDWKDVRSYSTVNRNMNLQTGPDPYIKGYYIEVWCGGKRVDFKTVAESAYTFSFAKNAQVNAGHPSRTVTLFVQAVDKWGGKSLKAARLAVSDPQPGKLTGPGTAGKLQHIFYRVFNYTTQEYEIAYTMLRWNALTDKDIKAYAVASGLINDPVEVIYVGRNTYFKDVINVDSPWPQGTIYIAAAFDEFDDLPKVGDILSSPDLNRWEFYNWEWTTINTK